MAEYAKIDLGKSPSSWDHLTRSQLLYVCGLFSTGKDENDFLTRITINIYGLKILKKVIVKGRECFHFLKKRQLLILSPEQLAELSRKLSWVMDQSDLTVQKIPVIRIGLRRYFGPDDKLFNISFSEYQSAENYFLAFNKTKDVKYLDYLSAVLYRSQIKHYNKLKRDASFKGDRREEFNDYLVGSRAKKFRNLDISHKYAIYQYFLGCVGYLQKIYPLVFQESQGTTETGNKIYNHTMLIEYLKGENINADPGKENIYQIMARCQRDRIRYQTMQNIKTNV